MGILERITRNIDNRCWDPGVKAFPVKNRYTAGVAGQKFFEEIKENGKIYGSRCEDCEITYLPARIYCERCFARLEENSWIDVGTEGTVYSYTVMHQTKSGEPREEPALIAAVKIADSLLIHRLGGCQPEDVFIGLPVRAEFKPKDQRQGGIEDIVHFLPL